MKVKEEKNASSRERKKQREKFMDDMIAEVMVNGGNVRNATMAVGIDESTHYIWIDKYEDYRDRFFEARRKGMSVKLQKAEDVGSMIIQQVLDKGVENCTKHEINAALSEAQYIRSSVGRDTYTTKTIQEVKVNDADKPTWDDVVAAITKASEEVNDGE